MSLMLSERFDRMPPNDEKLSDLRARKAKAEAGGGTARIEAQHKRGKLTARERQNY